MGCHLQQNPAARKCHVGQRHLQIWKIRKVLSLFEPNGKGPPTKLIVDFVKNPPILPVDNKEEFNQAIRHMVIHKLWQSTGQKTERLYADHLETQSCLYRPYSWARGLRFRRGPEVRNSIRLMMSITHEQSKRGLGYRANGQQVQTYRKDGNGAQLALLMSKVICKSFLASLRMV